MKQNATLDSSFWINAIAGGLIDHLMEDFELYVVPAVARELTETYPSGAMLHQLIARGRIALEAPKVMALERFGPGEREAISMVVQRRHWTLLIDDLRPFRAAEEMGLAPISTPVYAASLYSRGVLDEVGVLRALARLAARGTVSPQLIALALAQIATTLRERR